MSAFLYEENWLKWSFEIRKEKKKNYDFAYYVYQDERIIERIWYKEASKCEEILIKPIYSGAYKIRLFIRENKKIIFNEISSTLWIDTLHEKQIMTTFPSEKIFFSDNPVKYVFQEAKKDVRYLVLSFSGLYATEFQGGPPVYNHMRTLNSVKAHKLFILDSYQNQFCYYVGFGGEMDFERSVIALITKIANEYKVPPENIIATGSSKGGAAALYYSFKYQFGKAVIGAPQIYIAKYLEQRASSDSMRLRYHNLLGDHSLKGKAFWNGLILNQAYQARTFPELHFHVGKGDFHYTDHLKILLQVLDEKKVDYTLDLGAYEEHKNTGIYFTPFLLQKVQDMVTRKEEEQ